jgi:methyltransferase (TIGR00027 family)
MMAATGRAVHLLHHGPRALLQDWLAWPLVGPAADELVAVVRPLVAEQEVPFGTWFGARSRLAEDWLAEGGAEQYVVLGAGLDSFAWRQTGDVRVFEVDHPSTQEWKRARAEVLGLRTPSELTWVPVDFERERLGVALEAAGLDPARSTFVSWLGVIPYLTREAIIQTLDELPACSLAVGYVPPEESQDADARRVGAIIAAQVEALGEPYLTLTPAQEFAALVAEGGFTVLEDVGAHDIVDRYGLPAINYERMALARKA